MEEIIEFIMHYVERSGYYDKLGSGIVLTGGGAMLNHLAELTKLKTGLDVRIGSTSMAFSHEETQALRDPSLSTSIGLLIAAGRYPGSQRTREQLLFDDEETGQPEKEKKPRSSDKKGKKKKIEKKLEFTGDLFGNFKRSFAGMFEERDTEM
jgi:cell division protein FtsA